MPTPPPPIDPVPEPVPQRSDRATFSDRVDAFVTWLIDAVSQFGAVATNTYDNAVEGAESASQATMSAAAASASAMAAAAAVDVDEWVSGTVYAEGDAAWSPTDFYSYRARVALNPSTVDPAADPSNWQRLTVVAFADNDALNIAADTQLTNASDNAISVASTVKNSSLKLPDCTTLTSKNGAYLIRVTGSLSVPVRDADGTLLAVLPAGSSAMFACQDRSTSAGIWSVLAPDTKVGIVTGVAQVLAATGTAYCDVQAIPGTTNKALVQYAVSSASMRLAIATLNGDGTVSVGALTTVTIADEDGLMIAALSATAGLAAYATTGPVYTVAALALDTSANTVTVGSTTTVSGIAASPDAWTDTRPVLLDSTRCAWLVDVSTQRLVVAQNSAGTPTASQISVSATLGNNISMQLVGIGGGSILAMGDTAVATYTTSGVTPTLANSQAFVAGSMLSTNNYWFKLFTQGNSKVAGVGGPTAGPADSVFSIKGVGTTLPAPPVGKGMLRSPAIENGTAARVGSFVAGTSYCVSGTPDGTTFTAAIRVMRYTDDTLSEVAIGVPDDLPLAKVLLRGHWRAAGVNGQKCIAVSADKDGNPQICGLEVIKA